jgi:hypothetical protein
LTVREKGSTKPIPQEDPAAQRAAEDAAPSEERGEDQEGVFVVRKGKTEFVPVTVGVAGKDHFEVLTGLTEKDTVVAGPYDVIRTLEAGKTIRALPGAKEKEKGKGEVKAEAKP